MAKIKRARVHLIGKGQMTGRQHLMRVVREKINQHNLRVGQIETVGNYTITHKPIVPEHFPSLIDGVAQELGGKARKYYLNASERALIRFERELLQIIKIKKGSSK